MSFAVQIRAIAWRGSLEARGLRAAVRSGMLGLESPRTLRAIAGALRGYGVFGSASRIASLRHGDLPAIVDERGELTFTELDERVNRLANALDAKGLGRGSSVGVLCRNHRQLLIVAFAVARAGLNVIMLNTSFSARQCAEVAQREGVDLLVYDSELADAVTDVQAPRGKLAVAIDDPGADELDLLIATGAATLPPAPTSAGRIVILTSGTTGTPKGAPREDPRGFIGVGAMLERMPMRAREATVVAPPLFHGTGLVIALLSIGLGSKLVLRRRFDAARLLDDIATHHATVVCVVPIMLQRIDDLAERVHRADGDLGGQL
jgi:fatty-acyl-CoA synthase